MSDAAPQLAVVGHPNKGKSSIVATLAENDRVAIAPEPGTTQHARPYPVEVDGRTLYTLIDTPGFERPNQAFQWLRDQNAPTDQRPAVVRRFVETHAPGDRFSHECELLQPLIEGAGVLYVVDGSVPYGPDYEAEMEILRWTGRPRMALINPIGRADFIEPWQSALRQYFDIVRVFNATQAPFEKRIALLEAFGQLRDDWRQPLADAIDCLIRRRHRRRSESARAVAQMIADMVGMTAELMLKRRTDPRRYEAELAAELRDRLRSREQAGRREVEAIYQHHHIRRDEAALQQVETDLFNTRTWYLFGLSRTQLAGLSAAGGAVIGGMVDAGAGASTFLLGTAIGAAIGGASAWLSANRLQHIEVMKLPLGGRKLICGPVPSRNFPYVILGRAIQHHAVVAQRPHAARGAMVIGPQETDAHWIDALDGRARRRLEKAFVQCRRRRADETTIETITDEIEPLLDDDPGP